MTSLYFCTVIESEAYEKLSDTLENRRLCEAIKQASSSEQTSCLEAYHSVINHAVIFVPWNAKQVYLKEKLHILLW